MNGIGITQWRGTDAGYPLPSTDFAGVFCDASFVLFDNEQPFLQSIVFSDSVQLNFVFDGSNLVTFEIDLADCVANHVLRLRRFDRYYGTLVFGENIGQLINSYGSNTIVVATAFHASTVRTVNSQNGVYSVQGQTGGVLIGYDRNLHLGKLSGTNLSAISVPSQLTSYALQTGKLYLFDSNAQSLVEFGAPTQQNILNVNSSIVTIANTVSTPKPTITFVSSELVGVAGDTYGSYIYDCSSYPPVLLMSLSNLKIKEVAVLSGCLYALTVDGLLYNLGSAPYENNAPQLVNITYNGSARNLDLQHIAAVNEVTTPYLVAAGGSQHGYGDIYYSISTDGVSSSLGMFSLGGSYKVSGSRTIAVGYHNTQLSLFCCVDSEVYVIPFAHFNASSPATIGSLTSSYSKPISLVAGGGTISFNPVRPIAKVNDHAVGSANLSIVGDSIVTINRTAQDTITISMNIDESLTNIHRTQQYGQ